MAERAHITSVEALEGLRTALIQYRERASVNLHEISDEVRRTRNWVGQDRLTHWAGEIRRRTRALNDAQQRLFSAELSAMRETSTEEERAVKRGRERLREAEGKLAASRKWDQGFDSVVGPAAKAVEQLRGLVDEDLPKAIHALGEMIRALEAYEGGASPESASPDSEKT